MQLRMKVLGFCQYTICKHHRLVHECLDDHGCLCESLTIRNSALLLKAVTFFIKLLNTVY